MASKFLRRQKWWIKFRHPETGRPIRESLETEDEARAELLRQRLELEVALLDPRFRAVEIPDRLREVIGLADGAAVEAPVAQVTAPQSAVIPIAPTPVRRTTIEEAVATYVRFITAENAPLHVENKVSILRRFIGVERVEKSGGPVKTKRRRQKNGEPVPDPKPFFTGKYLDEITPMLVQEFIESRDLSRSTMRHQREMFHQFFEVCLRFDLLTPKNWHCPNPIAALPSYVTKNPEIIFLTPDEIEGQLAALESEPAIQMAAMIMIYAGLRRAEALWLTKDSIAHDYSSISVRIRRDDDTKSTLKTPPRPVTILPPLRAALQRYVPGLSSKWIVPNANGGRWRPDCFTNELRDLNRKAGLSWNCLHFRHTYATQRASEGWNLFMIAKEMGNSVQVVERNYAAYVRPPALTASLQTGITEGRAPTALQAAGVSPVQSLSDCGMHAAPAQPTA